MEEAMFGRSFVRYLILVFALLLNLAIAEVASAGFRDAVCEDPETGEIIPCCVWCVFFCGCDEELVP
jgi:hypothetical protein